MKIATGSDDLDKDLAQFFEFRDAGRLTPLNEILKRHHESSAAIEEQLPQWLIRLGAALERGIQNSADFSKEAKAVLRQAHSDLSSQLPEFQSILKDLPKPNSNKNALARNYNSPGSILSNVFLTGTPPNLVPVVRIGIADESDDTRLIFDSTMDSKTLLYMISSLSKISLLLFDNYKSFIESNQIAPDEINKDRIDKLIAKTKSNLDSLASLIPPKK